MYKAVFLDIGGVILKIDWEKPLEAAGIEDPRRRQEVLGRFQGSAIMHLYERGGIDTREFLSHFSELLEVKKSNQFWEDAWQSLIRGQLDGVEEIFDTLEGHVPLYAASNTNALHLQRMMSEFPVMKRFRKVFASNVLRERKPDAGFYLKCCELAKVGPSEVLFVDDTAENVEAAKRCGIKAQQTVNSVRGTLEFLRAHLGLPPHAVGEGAARSSRS